jgi:hypothetical protein
MSRRRGMGPAGLVLAAALALRWGARADMSVATYLAFAYLAGLLDALTKANQAATKAGAPLFCPPAGSEELEAQPLQALVDKHIAYSNQNQPGFAASAKATSLGSMTLTVLTSLYPCPSKGDSKD